MKINSNVVQPNFQARLKINDESKQIINKMTSNELDEFKKSLNKLSNYGQNDILEVTKEYGRRYIKNSNTPFKKEPMVEDDKLEKLSTLSPRLARCALVGSLMSVVDKIADPENALHHNLLTDKTETKAETKSASVSVNNAKEKTIEQKRQEVFDMMV